MDERTLNKEICLNLCPYYKPSKDNASACIGFLITERLINEGREFIFDMSDKTLNAITEEALVDNMCIACSFYESDCDFVQQKRDSLPCGGFTLIGHLLGRDIVTINDISRLIIKDKR